MPYHFFKVRTTLGNDFYIGFDYDKVNALHAKMYAENPQNITPCVQSRYNNESIVSSKACFIYFV